MTLKNLQKDFVTSDEEGGFKDLISQFRKAEWERDIDEMLRIQKFIFNLVENKIPEQEPVAYAVTVGSEMENNIGLFVDKEKAKECFEDASVGGYESLFKIMNLYTIPPSVAALEKQVAELKESLQFALQELNGEVSHNHQDYIQKYHLARERAK